MAVGFKRLGLRLNSALESSHFVSIVFSIGTAKNVEETMLNVFFAAPCSISGHCVKTMVIVLRALVLGP